MKRRVVQRTSRVDPRRDSIVHGNLRSFAAFVFSPEFAELSARPESAPDGADDAEHRPVKTPDDVSGGN